MKRRENLQEENEKLVRYVGIMFLIIIICVPLLFVFYSRCEQLQQEVEELREELENAEDEIFHAEKTVSELSAELADQEISSDSQQELIDALTEQCSFFDENAGIVTVSGEKYHTYSCWHWRTGSNIWIFNTAEAEARGYEPCLDCH